MRNNITVSVIVVYFNTPEDIINLLSSLKKELRRISHEIIIIDNHSDIPLPDEINRAGKFTVIRNKKNLGYGAALNIGANNAKGTYLLCTNSDIIYKNNSIHSLLKKIQSDPSIGVIGPKIVDVNNRRLKTASRYPLFPKNILLFSFLSKFPPLSRIEKTYHYNSLGTEKNVSAIGGACMLFRKHVFTKLNGFDKSFFLYFEETDICKRVHEHGYKVVYYPGAVITHFVGKSSSDRSFIRHHFEKSRYEFIKKHQSRHTAIFSESIIRFLTPTFLILTGIVVFSLFLNLSNITHLMMFFGDYGRDMLVARNMLLTGTVPLLGIPSSVVWLSQGPLSIYMIALSFSIGGYEAYVPAVFFGILGSLTCIGVYKLGNELYSKQTGILAALFFASSPFVIINSRIPYHTAPIPFFAAVFFFLAYRYSIKPSRNILFFTGLFLGFLFQLELSNGVLFFLLPIYVIIFHIRLTKKIIGTVTAGFFLGIFPFILYDLTHYFVQTLGFVAWVGNRIRLFFSMSTHGGTTGQLPGAIQIISENLVRFLFPSDKTVAFVLLGVCLIVLGIHVYKRNKNSLFLFFAIFISLIGFIVHARPGMAYFPVLFPLLSVMVGYTFSLLIQKFRVGIFIFFLIVSTNAFFVQSNFYFLDVNGQRGSEISDWNYGLGVSLSEQQKVVSFLKNESEKYEIQIKPGGFLKDFSTSIDNYRYLLLISDIQTSSNGRAFFIYQNKHEIPSHERIVFSTENVFVTNNE